MTYGGELVWACVGLPTTLGGGDASSDKHIPLNPIKKIEAPNTKTKQTYEYFANSLQPSIAIEDIIEAQEATISTYYRDPFALLLPAFTRKTVPATWTQTNDEINANMTSVDHRDYLWLMLYLRDQSSTNHLQYLFDGGEITGYKWIGEPGKIITEEATISFTEEPVSDANAIDIDNGFDDGSFDNATLGWDGGWSMWDSTYSTHTAAATKDATVTWGGSAIGDMNIKKWTLEAQLPKNRSHTTSSLTATQSELGKRKYIFEIEGSLQTNTNFEEVLATYSNKTKQTLKITFGNQYLQFTNAIIDDRDPFLAIPESGKVFEPKIKFLGGVGSAFSYQWKGNEAVDPSAFIQHADP